MPPRLATGPSPRPTRDAVAGRSGGALAKGRRLCRYEPDGRGPREIVEIPGADGSRLVVDRDACGGDHMLLAHLTADEPRGNADLVCERYLEARSQEAVRCRALRDEDLRRTPFTGAARTAPFAIDAEFPLAVPDSRRRYRLELVAGSMRIPELRWRRSDCRASVTTVSLRDVVGDLEAYEPACDRTRGALAVYTPDARVSTTVLALELGRVQRSAIVLNRGLREAVVAALAREELSMSEIAIRCGRVKHDARGNISGETSWLARRLGLLAEGGHDRPTPWIHSDVLGLIAREGLGISPREVEL